MAIIRRGREVRIRKINDDSLIEPYVEELQMSLENIQKGGYDHFMLKEIFEQPKAIQDTLRGRLLSNEGVITLSSLREHENRFLKAKRILVIACVGLHGYAGLVAEYLFEEFTRIPVEVEYASEFRYRNPIIYPDDVVIAISPVLEKSPIPLQPSISPKKKELLFMEFAMWLVRPFPV